MIIFKAWQTLHCNILYSSCAVGSCYEHGVTVIYGNSPHTIFSSFFISVKKKIYKKAVTLFPYERQVLLVTPLPVQGSGMTLTRTASANQNASNNIPREKPEDLRPCLIHKLKHSSKAKDTWIPQKSDLKKIILSDGARSLMTRAINFNQLKQTTFTVRL